MDNICKINIGHKIIIEGCDGVGKTTIAERIRSEHPEMNYKIVHCTRHTPNNYNFFLDYLLSPDNIIFDRFCYGQFVYQNSKNRKDNKWLSIIDLMSIEDIIRKYCFEVLYVYTDIDKILYNCKKDSEDSYYTKDYISTLDINYRYLFNSISSLDTVEYIYNDYKLDDEDIISAEKTFDYSKLPEIYAVDFDGCLATDCFPDIDNAKPNNEFIEYLKCKQKEGTKIILWTCRTGQSLVDACNFLADQGFYPDKVNENIDELLGLEDQPRKVYADKYFDDKSVLLKFQM